jgi:hypothetical protein
MPADAIAESSPATFEFPTDQAARAEFLKSGNLPEPTKETQPQGESAPPASAEPSGEPAESAPASAADKQENGKAAQRLNELLADLKKAGFTPAELKTFRRQAQAESAKPPEKTEVERPKPQTLEAPVKPKQEDFATWEEFQEAKDKYHEDFADYKAKLAVHQDRQERAAAESQREADAQIAGAIKRYGAESGDTIREAARAINTTDGVNQAVKQTLIESSVLVDVLYVLGSKPEDLQAFIDLAKSNPGQAIRRVVVLEQLVEQELSKGKGAAPTGEAPERGEDGKFKPTPKKVTTPPPPDELNTRGSAATDPIEAAVKNNDFAAFKAEDDRRDLARRRGA